jgi:hypothetical protein
MDADLLETWRTELELARQRLTNLGATASIRGEANSIFLLVSHEGRAAEICGDDVGGYNVQLWDVDSDHSDHDVDVPGIEDAIRESRMWLLR